MSYRGKSIFVCLLLVSACLCFQARRGETARHSSTKALVNAAALQGEAAIRQLKSDGSYASLAAAMAAARDEFNDEARAVNPAPIDSILTQQRKLTAMDAAAGDRFGAAVALSGNTAVIGAPLDDVTASNQGSVYVFVRSGRVWTPQQKLTASDGAAFDLFGGSVALSGDIVVVGASGDDVGANENQGSAYVFTRSGATWTPQQKLTANDGADNDRFGGSVALSGDTVVAGVNADDIGANTDQGSAYVFTRGGAGWTQQQRLTANGGADGDEFGFHVAVSGDTVVVGAPQDDVGANLNQGSAYVFVRGGTSWSQQKQLLGGDGAPGDFFGCSVAISGDTAAVGAKMNDFGLTPLDQGSVYIFARTGTNWLPQQQLWAANGAEFDQFGQSVALSGDTLVVGAVGDDLGANDQGSAYVFARSGATWSQQRRLFSDDGAADDLFGVSVAISGDSVLVGASNDNGAFAGQGAAYVFVIGANNHVQQQQLLAVDAFDFELYGQSVALSGDTVVVGAPTDFQGAASVFTRSGTVWTFQEKLRPLSTISLERFGQSVALSGDTLVVGAPGRSNGKGAAFVFTRSGTVWTEQAELTAADGASGEDFGESVALSGDTVVVGAYDDAIGVQVGQGSAYVFVRSGTVWTQQQKLTANDASPNDFFGRSVALSGDTLVVGANADDIGVNEDQGSAYVFTRSGTVWIQQQRLTADDGAANDLFGWAVALSGDTVAVGAHRDDIGANQDQGSVYAFTRVGTVLTQQQKLTANDGAAGDNFGFSVALSGDTVAVGAFNDDIGGKVDQGAAYVFTRSGTTWMQQPKLTANDGAAGDKFGRSVALSGDTVAVGANFKTIGANINQGAAYVFVRPACPTITLNPASLPGAQLGASYSQTLTASGGTGPYQFSLSEGALPTGLTLAQNGLLSGTPTTAGTYRFTITGAILSSLCPGSRSYTLTVTGASCPTLTINPASLPAGQSGVIYGQTVMASGGGEPYSFTLSAGALPTGLTLFSLPGGGVLTGTPTVAGNFNFTVRATDANGCQGTRDYTLTIGSSGCSFSVAPANHAFLSEVANGEANVTTGNGCAWTAAPNDPWITITSGATGSGNGTVRFAVAKNQDAAARRGTLSIAGHTVTVVQGPPIACVSAASFAQGALATESIVAAFGAGLAKSTEAPTTQPLPTTLAGTKVSVMDSLGTERLAPLFFVSPTQINFQVPPGTAAGKALVTVIHEDEMVAAGSPQIEMVSPGLFSANASGQGLMIGVALRVKADGSQSFEPVARFDEETQQFVAAPIDLGAATDRVFLVLFATGVRYRSALSTVSVKIGGVNTDALYAGPQGEFVGLDQLNVLLPRNLAGRSEVEVAVMIDGKESNALKVAIK